MCINLVFDREPGECSCLSKVGLELVYIGVRSERSVPLGLVVVAGVAEPAASPYTSSDLHKSDRLPDRSTVARHRKPQDGVHYSRLILEA